MVILSILELLPQDPIYGMQVLFKNDPRPNKINLSIGVCQEPNGTLTRFQAVEKAIEKVFQKRPSKEYLPLTGYLPFCQQVAELVAGKNAVSELFCMQTVGGTGALYVAAKLALRAGVKEIFIPEPSWPNHRQLFEAAGLVVKSYPYYDRKHGKVDFVALQQAITKMPAASVILLQASCHNPTGADLLLSEWKMLSTLIKQRNLLPLFDLAYQGFGKSVEQDAEAVRLFLEEGHEVMCATTLAKSFGLYNDRVGALLVRSEKLALESIASHAKSIVRTCYSSPPAHGVHIVATLLENEELKQLWLHEMEMIRKRLIGQREKLYTALQKRKPSFSYEHLKSTNGLFCLFDFSDEKVKHLREHEGVYIALDGRVCVAAITDENVEHVAEVFCR